jgi:hypothetical protein
MALSLLQFAQELQPGLNSLYRSKGSDYDMGLGDILVQMVQAAGSSQYSLAVANLASGGSVGIAPLTVDQYGSFLIDQTTASQTISLPSPSNPAIVRTAYLVNSGSVSFNTVSGTSVAAGKAQGQLWNGSAWVDLQ